MLAHGATTSAMGARTRRPAPAETVTKNTPAIRTTLPTRMAFRLGFSASTACSADVNSWGLSPWSSMQS
ncbi:hypothetical protein D187_005348 [Cystobacter fuscus DSM 2262]|uniref:Uncharacterized protein n=1 Tax=Cystobacter fuscus (strain ATCC 25194 / DSM 2262 / NBRC 100088 / M29) TaxID=1242864 RepID=S9QSF8_CYSF2|nr:hypothetical protein D187_005348 [Cystobacter fuscus DSM 2262]